MRSNLDCPEDWEWFLDSDYLIKNCVRCTTAVGLCSKCNKDSIGVIRCLECRDGYIPDPININYCYCPPLGFFIDPDDLLCKPCSDFCITCVK
jgi:hypothetical protein